MVQTVLHLRQYLVHVDVLGVNVHPQVGHYESYLRRPFLLVLKLLVKLVRKQRVQKNLLPIESVLLVYTNASHF